jgi:UDP-N-acetylglucosamine--N-acetylmuramyl-(pentapeptide) pyrophosphoryl-undecaprenol N-acetylglucosamine transferase
LGADGRAEIITQKEFTSDFVEAQIDRLLKAAAHAPINGDDHDLDAAQKIVALTDFALKS